MTDPVSERPSALKRRARRPLHEAARSAYASTLGDAQREEKKRLRRADVARRARAEAEGLGQGCLAATSGAQPGFPQGGGTKGEGTGNKGGGKKGKGEAPLHMQVPRRPAHAWHAVTCRGAQGGSSGSMSPSLRLWIVSWIDLPSLQRLLQEFWL